TGLTLLGQIDGMTVITLKLSGDVVAEANGGTATPTLTVVLANNLPHEDLPDFDSLTINGIVVNGADTEGVVITGNVNITVIDDEPVAVDDPSQSIAEDAEGTIGGNVLDNDTQGGDGATLTHVDLPGPGGFVAITSGEERPDGVHSFTVDGIGTYTFKADGSW